MIFGQKKSRPYWRGRRTIKMVDIAQTGPVIGPSRIGEHTRSSYVLKDVDLDDPCRRRVLISRSQVAEK